MDNHVDDRSLVTWELPPWALGALLSPVLIFLFVYPGVDEHLGLYLLKIFCVVLEIILLFWGFARKIYFTADGLEYHYFGRCYKTIPWDDFHQSLVLMGRAGATFLIFVPKEIDKYDPKGEGLSRSQDLYIKRNSFVLVKLDPTDENIANTRKYFQDFDFKAPLTRYNGSDY